MIERPKVEYVENDGVNIAYSCWGEGDEVVVYTPPWVSNVELNWDVDELARGYEHAGEHHRIVIMDKRGVGLSDRTGVAPSLEDRVSDTLAVMDAVGLAQACIVGASEAGATGVALAAHFPNRVAKLVLIGCATPGISFDRIARFIEPGDPAPSGLHRLEALLATWGTVESPFLEHFAPDVAGDPRVEAWARRFERQSASPGSLKAHLESAMLGEIDVLLDRVECPTLIAHCRGDLVVPVACGRLLASRIPHATTLFWDDRNHFAPFSRNWRTMQDEIIEFITGHRPVAHGTAAFAVVLFTDIVDSTRRASELGDAGWARLVRDHDAAVAVVVDKHGGRVVKSTGDGVLAVFNEPGRAVVAAQLIRDEIKLLGLDIRVGLHAGQVETHPDGDVTGIAVNLAARVEAIGEAGEICVSNTIRDLLLGSEIGFESLGAKELKGIEHEVEVLRLLD
ncbi:MAG: adenylate/guanylate cyclase domain-containing protein [Acidimicrobiales bacterium]